MISFAPWYPLLSKILLGHHQYVNTCTEYSVHFYVTHMTYFVIHTVQCYESSPVFDLI